MIRALAGKL